MKEKKGSSRQAIMKHIASTYQIVPNILMLKKAIKKMVEEGKLVAGAQAGRSGSGSFKVSNEEKTRIKQEEKAAAKKSTPSSSKSKVVKKVAKAKVAKKGAKSKVAKKVVAKTPQKVVKAKKGGMKPKKVAKKAKK